MESSRGQDERRTQERKSSAHDIVLMTNLAQWRKEVAKWDDGVDHGRKRERSEDEPVFSPENDVISTPSPRLSWAPPPPPPSDAHSPPRARELTPRSSSRARISPPSQPHPSDQLSPAQYESPTLSPRSTDDESGGIICFMKWWNEKLRHGLRTSRDTWASCLSATGAFPRTPRSS